ncbi:MAG: hypothetical protein GX868_07195 [Actinobacteria bacterium]|nr:hypothetical protein [Actinomycetota bacterium]
MAALMMAVACVPAMPPAIDAATARTASAVAGDDGPCAGARYQRANPGGMKHEVSIFLPVGQGFCGEANRPLIVFAHGYVGFDPGAYQATIDHLVSRGFVVIFPAWTVDFDPPMQYHAVNVGIDVGMGVAGDRVDTSRVGVVGHSWGGGMVPWLMQRVSERGWGSEALFGVSMSPAWAHLVGDGPIQLPGHARLLAITYEDDVFVDMQIAVEMLDAATIADEQKRHLLVHSDNRFEPALEADHLLPLSMPGNVLGEWDHLDRWATFRPIDATANCALFGTDCTLDLADMGVLHGVEVRRGTVGLGLADVGPAPALAECGASLSPRPCTFG